MSSDKDIRWKQRFNNFEKAYLFLSESMETPNPSRLEKAGIVQTFEFTFELGWKTLKDFLESKNVAVSFPRDVFKEAFRAHLIEDGEAWLDMLDKRNLMSHTYDETNAAAAMKLIREKYFQALGGAYDSLKKNGMNQFGLTEAAMKVIVGKIASHPEIDKAVIFGSRAIGNFKNGSDVDIALFGNNVSFYLTADVSAELNEHTTQPYFFDLLNFNSIDNDDLKKHVVHFGKVIYEKSAGV